MVNERKTTDEAQRQHLIEEMRRQEQERRKGYRERAFKLFPPVCARCGREFEGKRLRELTVHHIDHNHDNNPPDGSNWELLCIYCHDHEHTRGVQQDRAVEGPGGEARGGGLSHSPFAALADRFKDAK